MKKQARRIAATVLFLTPLVGCANKGMIHVSSIAVPLRAVAERHDAYVTEDASISELERRIYLRSSSLLIEAIDAAEDSPEN